jgi:hypothetical protein
MSPKKFWKLSWYELAMYMDKYNAKMEEKKTIQEAKWQRFRIQWADFRNVNRPKHGRIWKPEDLIKLSFDTDRKAEYHEIDVSLIDKKLGSKIKRKNGK